MHLASWWSRFKRRLSRPIQVEAASAPPSQSQVAVTLEWLETLPELPTDAIEELSIEPAMEEEGMTYRLSPEEYAALLAANDKLPLEAVPLEATLPPVIPPCPPHRPDPNPGDEKTPPAFC